MIHIDVMSCNAVLSAGDGHKPWALAMVLLRDLQMWHLRPTPVTCSASVVSMKDQWKKAIQLLVDFRYAQVEINVILGEMKIHTRVAV